MNFDAVTFIKDLLVNVISDDQRIAVMVDNFIDNLYQQPDILRAVDGEEILQVLKKNRMFDEMQKIFDVFIRTGVHSFEISRLYAQSLIDAGNYTSAISILNTLIADLKDSTGQEYAEVQGLRGSVYKKLYIDTDNQNQSQKIGYIKLSISAYLSAYNKNTAVYLFYGINAVALLWRAEKDRVVLSSHPDYMLLARDILTILEERYAAGYADGWDFALAAEACIALNKPEDALQWISGYVRAPQTDAFELASTLVQLEKIWLLSENSRTGRLLLPLVRGELLKRGGNIMINAAVLAKQRESEEGDTTPEYIRLLNRKVDGKTEKADPNDGLEKIFNDDSFKTCSWYQAGADCCLAIAHIGKDPAIGYGTGFLLKGSTLLESLGEEIVLMTCAHVVSDDPEEKALRSDETVIIFEALNRVLEFRIFEILWSSPSRDLDTTIIRFSREDQDKLEILTKNIKPYTLAKHLPGINANRSQQIYIVGHPFGGTRQISFQDNLLLDHDETRIHYRTPSEGGSGGSPVFNDHWKLIGIHHTASANMSRSNGQAGNYEANEGISILAVRNKLKQELVKDDIPDYFIQKGQKLELAKKPEEALKTYTEGYDRFPQAYEFLKKMSDVFKSTGDENQHFDSLKRYNEEKNRITLEGNLKKKLTLNYFTTGNHPFYGDLLWPLNPHMNILLGKNGYGKSHLLSIILALLENNYEKTREFSASGSRLAVSINMDDDTPLSVAPENEIIFSDKGLESLPGKIPVLAIPDSRFIDKSSNSIGRSKETFNVLSDSAIHFLYQKPYSEIIENSIFRACQVYTERTNKNEKLTVVKLIENLFYKLTGSYFTVSKIESMPDTTYEILVNTEAAENLQLQKVSQGTFSVISTILLIFNYLKARYDVSDEEVQYQSAIVFIDEIDAHLHPSWQQKIINILRETFPSVQFIITGHSPLIVAGCRIGEVAVLRKAKPGFALDFVEHDFIGYQTGELYKTIFEIESYDETYLKYNSLLPFKGNYEKQIEDLEAKENKDQQDTRKLEQLYNDVYYMDVVKQKNSKKEGLFGIKPENETRKKPGQENVTPAEAVINNTKTENESGGKKALTVSEQLILQLYQFTFNDASNIDPRIIESKVKEKILSLNLQKNDLHFRSYEITGKFPWSINVYLQEEGDENQINTSSIPQNKIIYKNETGSGKSDVSATKSNDDPNEEPQVVSIEYKGVVRSVPSHSDPLP